MNISEKTTEETLKLQEQLVDLIRQYKSVAVAYSGGVDSAVVAKGAALALGENAIAVMSVSPSLATGELEKARKAAEEMVIRFQQIKTQEYLNPDYQKNSNNRCYFCKHELYSSILEEQKILGFEVILNGANADDKGDHRPGMIAAREFEIKSPLMELGITKKQVREIALAWGLSVWDKPATPCLASRIAYGIEVTVPRLKRVDLAEKFLQEEFGIRELRVRDLGDDLARIDVPCSVLHLFQEEKQRNQVIEQFRRLGFQRVELNLEGFQSGILNQVKEIKTEVLI